MNIQLSDHFSAKRLLRFTWPSMMMMIVTSVYGVVDGVMVSNFVGTTAFASLNLIWPFIAILGSVGFMLGTGGSALVAKTLGEGKEERARQLFSMITYVSIAIAILLGIIGLLLVRPVSIMMGAQGEMIDYCVTYGRILLFMLPAYLLQVFFQSLLVVAEKPKMGMWVTVGAGVMNMILDVLFIGVWHWGLPGAAWATGASQIVGGIIPLCYFVLNRKNRIRLGCCSWDYRAFGIACYNGMSEFVMQIAMSVVSMLYMWQLMREVGENGVSAYGIMMYFAFTFVAVYIGYGVGSAPVVSYHYGAGNKAELKSLLLKSLKIIGGLSVVIALLAQVFARPLCGFFVGYDTELLDLTVHAFRIYSLMFLFAGYNIYSSSLFTALNNGLISALISLSRTLICESAAVLLLPVVFGIEGIWWAVDVAEGVSVILSFLLIWHYREAYGYL